MDTNILKAILHSCEDVMNDIEKLDDYKQLKDDNSELYLPSMVLVDGLCRSLANLLSYKVSKEAYQRYSVRHHIIEFLRDCCRISSPFTTIHAFTQGENTIKFVERLVAQHLTEEILQNCMSGDALEPLARSLLHFAEGKEVLKVKAEEVILRITQLESTDKCQKLLCDIVKNYVNIGFKTSTIECIYESQKFKLIEQPLLNSFILSCPNMKELENNNDCDNLQTKCLMEQLLNFVITSPKLFRIVSNCMKEMMTYLGYSPDFIDFIQSTLNQISEICQNQQLDILDLYPKCVQHCIILLRINPSSHTESSKEYTLESLKEIYLKNREDILVLLSHFPEWLEPFSTHIKTGINELYMDIDANQ